MGTPDEYVDLQTAIQAMTNKAQLTPLESFYVQDKRPLICAYNIPAVVLTLGEEKWSQIREPYLELCENQNLSVGRTLAASVGEIAKIIGISHARTDLVNVWWAFVKSRESEVRYKALESLTDFMDVVGAEVGKEIMEELLNMWKRNSFQGWRERHFIVKMLPRWLHFIGLDKAMVFKDLIFKGLEDPVADVRETAVSVVSSSCDDL